MHVEVDQLILGRRTQAGIHDEQGVLLLSSGSEITERFLELLRQRESRVVVVSPEDAFELIAPQFAEDTIQFEDAMIQNLHETIDRSSLTVENKAQPTRDNVVLYGCRGYDQKFRRQLFAHHTATAKSLAKSMKSVISGESLSASAVTTLTAEYLAAMTKDMDAVMSVAAETGRDRELSMHCVRMSVFGMAIALEMGYDDENVSKVGISGLMHDWGIIRVPKSIRQAPRKLTDFEMLEIKKHPIHTVEILGQIEGLPQLIAIVCYQVHEQPNGEGYPRGHGLERIHEFATILAVASAYAALTAPRPYRSRLMPYDAMVTLLHMVRDGQLDRKPVEAFLHLQSLFPIGSYVRLSDGSIAQSIRRNGNKYQFPLLRRVALSPQDLETDTERVFDPSEDGLRITAALRSPGGREIPCTPETTLLFW